MKVGVLMKCLVIGSTVADIMIYMDKLPTSQGVITALSTGKTLHEAVDFANLVSSKVVGVNGVHLEEGIYEELRQSL